MVFAMPRGRRPSLLRARAVGAPKLAVVGAAIDPSTRVSELSVADRQLVEIAKALALEPKVLVLDEPTESLTPVESELLFDQVRAITAAGTAVVYISHRLPEVQRIADRITVLRDGETRGTVAAASVSEAEILAPDHRALRRSGVPAQGRARGRQRAAAERARPLRAALPRRRPRRPARRDRRARRRRGQRAARVPARARRTRSARAATATLAGERVGLRDPGSVQRAGIVHLPGDRHAEGVLLPLSVRENVSLLALGDVSRTGVVQRRREAELVSGQIKQLDVRTPRHGDARRRALGRQPAEGAVRALAARRTRRCCSPTSRPAGSTPTRASSSTSVLRRAAEAGQAVIVALLGRRRAAGAVRPGRRVLARPGGAHARGRGDHRGEHHRRRDHVGHAALGGAGERAQAPAVAALRRRRLPADGGAPGAHRRAHALHVRLERPLPDGVQLRQHAAARERARVHRARPADRHADRRHRPLGRPSRRSRRGDHVLLRRRGSERRDALPRHPGGDRRGRRRRPHECRTRADRASGARARDARDVHRAPGHLAAAARDARRVLPARA